jgi:hypothetical protein
LDQTFLCLSQDTIEENLSRWKNYISTGNTPQAQPRSLRKLEQMEELHLDSQDATSAAT